MLSCEATGKNIEQAINNALFELKATRDDVDIKILDEGGFFRKAKVFVSISDDCKEKYMKEEKPTLEETATPVEDKFILPKDDIEDEVDVIKSVDNTNEISDIDKAKTFAKNILDICGINADIISEENKNEIFLNLIGAGEMIGFRGEGINGFQYLLNVFTSKNNRHSKKIRLDIDNYRSKRENTLKALALRMARKVAKTGHSVKLEPMTANERRIMHEALADDKYVETFSKGEEPYRCLVIALKSNKKNSDNQ